MEAVSQNNKRIAKNSIYMTIRMVIVLAIGLYTTRAILGVLGVEDYGVYNVVCGFVSMFAFLNTSMSNGIQRFYNFELGKNGIEGAKKVYNMSLLVQLIMAALIILFTETIGLWYLNHKMVIPVERSTATHWIFQLSIINFLFVTLKAPYVSAVMAHERMNFYAIMSVANSVLSLVIVFALTQITYDKLITYGLLLTLISFFDFLLYFFYCKRFKEIVFQKKLQTELLRSMLVFSGWNIFGTFGGIMKEQGVNMIMNLFFGPVVNAARGVAMQVSSGLQSFVSNLSVPVRPQLTQSYAQGDIDRVMRLTYSISKLSCCCLFIIALPILLEIDFVLKIWLGSNIPEHTSAFVWIVVISSFASNLNAAISGVVHSSGKMAKYQLSGCIINLLTLPLAYYSLHMGCSPEIALLVGLIMAFIGQYVSLIVMKSIVNFSMATYFRMVVKPLIAVVLLSIPIPTLIYLILDSGIIRFIVITFVSVSCSLLVTYFIALIPAEKKVIDDMLTKIVRKS